MGLEDDTYTLLWREGVQVAKSNFSQHTEDTNNSKLELIKHLKNIDEQNDVLDLI